jgi:restriction system protein
VAVSLAFALLSPRRRKRSIHRRWKNEPSAPGPLEKKPSDPSSREVHADPVVLESLRELERRTSSPSDIGTTRWTGAMDSGEARPFHREALDTSRWSLELLRALEWKRFELVCAAYFEALGFRARTTRAGADGGVDIHIYADGDSNPAMIVQCKAWNAYKVGIKPIRELFGVMANEGVTEGVFLTTGQFTQEAREFRQGDKLHLWDGSEFLQKIENLVTDKRAALLGVATKGDFTTPTCPSCDKKMVKRKPKRGGEEFWGCRNYPRCKQTFN